MRSNRLKIDRQILFHSRYQLQQLLEEELAKPEPQDDLVYELSASIEFIGEEFGNELLSLPELVEKGLITFQFLWTLFPPNVLAIGQDEFRQDFGFFVRDVREVEDNKGNVMLRLNVDHLDHDGKDLVRRVGLDLKIPKFHGTMEIADLPYLPLSLHGSPETVKSKLLLNAKKAMKFHGRCLAEHKGPGLKEIRDSDGWNGTLIKFNSHGRVMLDPVTLNDTEPSNVLLNRELKAFKEEAVEDEDLMTLSPKLYGFSLGDKVWGMSSFQAFLKMS